MPFVMLLPADCGTGDHLGLKASETAARTGAWPYGYPGGIAAKRSETAFRFRGLVLAARPVSEVLTKTATCSRPRPRSSQYLWMGGGRGISAPGPAAFRNTVLLRKSRRGAGIKSKSN